MTERPILLSGAEVRAILAGAKTQLRRAVTVPWKGSQRSLPYEPYFVEADGQLMVDCSEAPDSCGGGDYREFTRCMPATYGAAGDRLWVRETWGLHAYGDESDWLRGPIGGISGDDLRAHWDLAWREEWGPLQEGCYWRSSAAMPRWASRITLDVTAVRVERLQAISEADARADGAAWRIAPGGDLAGAFDGLGGEIGYVAHFRDLWDRVNAGRAPWADNPWVWVVEFKAAT